MRRRKFLAGAGALAAIPGMGHADPHPQGKTPEQHSALPPGITPSAFANDKTYFSPITIAEYFTYADDLGL